MLSLESSNKAFNIINLLLADNALALAIRAVIHFFEKIRIMDNHVGNSMIIPLFPKST